MKLTPLADNVLLKHMEAEEKTASGIILSTATKEKSVIAEVIAAGPGTDDVKAVSYTHLIWCTVAKTIHMRYDAFCHGRRFLTARDRKHHSASGWFLQPCTK